MKMTQVRFTVYWSKILVSILGLLAGPLTLAEEFRLQIPQLAGAYAYGQSRGPVPFDLGSCLSTVAVIRVEITGTSSMGWWDGDDVENFYHGPVGASLYFKMNSNAAYPYRWVATARFGTNGPFSQTITLRQSGGGTNWDFLRDGISDLSVNHSVMVGWGDMTIPPQVTISSLIISIEAERAPEDLSIRVSQVELCWDTATNGWYQVQYHSSLTTNQWSPLTEWLRGSGNLFCTNDPVLVGQPQRFYRIARTNAPP